MGMYLSNAIFTSLQNLIYELCSESPSPSPPPLPSSKPPSASKQEKRVTMYENVWVEPHDPHVSGPPLPPRVHVLSENQQAKVEMKTGWIGIGELKIG